ncbi:hypothetical protein EMIT07CA2_180093 [Brevibacillus sp. IT-7CA2]
MNPVGLGRVTDVLLTFDLQAAFDAERTDTAGLSSLWTPPPTAKLRFALNRLPLPLDGKVTNLAVFVPGVEDHVAKAFLKIISKYHIWYIGIFYHPLPFAY